MVKRIYQQLISESLRKKIAYLRSDLANQKQLPADVFFFKRKRVIFIHIPKAAGLSLYKAVFKIDSFGHETIRHYEDFLSQRELKKYYKFSFVRNPYDRIHSAYYYLRAGGREHAIDLEYAQMLQHINSFESFILDWLNKENIYKIQHFIPQTYFLKNYNNEIKFDFIGKFENLEQDFGVVTKNLNIDIELLFLNKTKSKKLNFMSEYTQEMFKVVNELYHEDFELLGYKKVLP